MKNTFAGLCLLFILAVSCKKEVSGLPDETQAGANTFGASVNGSFWIPKGFGPFPADNLLEARRLGQDVLINARNFASSPNETEIEIYLGNVTGTGTYQLNTTTTQGSFSGSYGYYVKRNLTPENEWITSTSNTGSVTLTRYDTVAKVISGTFRFNALNIYNAPSPLAVTDGRFDIKF